MKSTIPTLILFALLCSCAAFRSKHPTAAPIASVAATQAKIDALGKQLDAAGQKTGVVGEKITEAKALAAQLSDILESVAAETAPLPTK